jgi:hypothetical protein
MDECGEGEGGVRFPQQEWREPSMVKPTRMVHALPDWKRWAKSDQQRPAGPDSESGLRPGTASAHAQCGVQLLHRAGIEATGGGQPG